MLALLRILPLLVLVVGVYMLVLATNGVMMGGFPVGPDGQSLGMQGLLSSPLFTIKMVSGPLVVSKGALFVVFGLIAMFVEVLRSTRTDSISITNHILSTIVLVLCLVLLIVVNGCNTIEFLYLCIMALVDVTAGVTVSIVAARRDFGGAGIVTN